MSAMTNASGAAPVLWIENAWHSYGTGVALDSVSLKVDRGEFLTLLGQSGSGKTTLLRIIGGLEQPRRIDRLDMSGEDMRQVPAAQRNCTTVFQGYALFPHLSVLKNVEFGLQVRGVEPGERRRRALEAIDMVRLSAKHDRAPHQLSGGERQRVALARALVVRPSILLLDEPLGALDERLRLDMQVDLLNLQRQLGMTFIYVTHSQDEALTMSDRIALMWNGRIEQCGPPKELYNRPVSRFVADFMGCANLLGATIAGVSRADGEVLVSGTAGGQTIRGYWTGRGEPSAGDAATVAVRAENVVATAEPGSLDNSLPAIFGQQIYKGGYTECTAETALGRIQVRIQGQQALAENARYVGFAAAACTFTSNTELGHHA